MKAGAPRTAVMLVGRISANPAPDEQDTLTQADELSAELAALGHAVERRYYAPDAPPPLPENPSIVFNLVESIDGRSRHIESAPVWLEYLARPFTGCGGTAIAVTNDKTMAKQVMRGARIPTAGWLPAGPARIHPPDFPGPYILKPVCEHGSVGIDEENVVTQALAVPARVREFEARHGVDFFVEAYIEGREFNLAVLDGPDGPCVLPPAEMCFEGYADGKARVLGYRAKWDDASFESRHTLRRFEYPPEDVPLLDRIRRVALECWNVFGLSGYARVDLRVDGSGTPNVLEINANPCLSRDAGFMAAARQAGLGPGDVVARIVAAGLFRLREARALR